MTRPHRALALILLCAACASGIRYTVDDAVIARLPPADRAPADAAQAELDAASNEQRQTGAALSQVTALALQCEKESADAAQAAERAVADQKKAEQAGDMEQINTA